MEAWLKFLKETFPSMTIDEIQIMIGRLLEHLMHFPSAEYAEDETAGGPECSN